MHWKFCHCDTITSVKWVNGINVYAIALRPPSYFTETLKPQAFAAQTSLERLDLRDNRISTIESGAFDGLNQPKEIYLSGNRLSKMNSDVFQVCFRNEILRCAFLMN